MRKTILLVSAVLTGQSLCGQQTDEYDYYLKNDVVQQKFLSGLSSEPELFYFPLEGNADLFSRMSAYNFSSVRYARRGYGDFGNGAMLNRIELSDELDTYPDYTLLSGLRRARLPCVRTSGTGIPDTGTASVGETEEFAADASVFAPGHTVSLYGTNRRHRFGIKAASAGTFARNWSYAVSGLRRWGRDATVKGVFTDETAFSLMLSRRIGEDHHITFYAFGSANERGLRSSATREAFDLTGDLYYNPSWGYFDGEVRNSRVAREFQPLFLATYSGRLGAKTDLEVSASYRFGKSGYTSLAWYDAQTPYPDYYRNMPSYADNPTAAALITGLWENREPATTQIDWDELSHLNTMSPDGAAYILEERIEDIRRFQAVASARTRFDKRTEAVYGIRFKTGNTLFYKKMKDLLSGVPVPDVDCYLIDDEMYGDKLANDVRHPGRRIGTGDRFGYSYRMFSDKYEVFASLKYADSRLRFAAGVNAARSTLQRQGYYEKELFPGNLSFGRSKRLSFETYSAKVSGGYSFSPRHIVNASLLFARTAPGFGNIFLSPNYTNATVPDVKTIGQTAVDLDYILTLNALKCKVAFFYARTTDGTEVYRYYDDILSVYSDMTLSGISRRYYGAEAAARYDLSSRLSLSVIASLGNYTYDSDPSVCVVEDASGETKITGAKSFLKGYRCSPSPGTAVSAELKYNASGWIASLTYSYMADRYVTVTPLRRMERAYNLAGSPERFSEFVAQEELGDASVLDLFLLKSFQAGHARLTLMFSINNLLDRKFIYGGYEQMRIMRRGSGTARQWSPFDSKYLYGYGRGYYISVSCKF